MQENDKISEYRQKLKSIILEAAMKAFISEGIRAVKMDDIANSLSISKRTVYELFSNKEDLLLECVKMSYHKKRMDMKAFTDNKGHNVMDIFLYAFSQKVKDIKSVNPLFYSEIAKYPKLIQFSDKIHKEAKQEFLLLLRRGTDEGYFCSPLNHELIASVIDMQNQFVMEKKLYQKYPMDMVFFNLIHLSLRGLCTQKGITELDKFIHDFKKENNL